MDFQNLIQAEFGEGSLNVHSFDNCYEYTRIVTWEEVGGDKNEMQITGARLLGDSVSYEVNIRLKYNDVTTKPLDFLQILSTNYW